MSKQSVLSVSRKRQFMLEKLNSQYDVAEDYKVIIVDRNRSLDRH